MTRRLRWIGIVCMSMALTCTTSAQDVPRWDMADQATTQIPADDTWPVRGLDLERVRHIRFPEYLFRNRDAVIQTFGFGANGYDLTLHQPADARISQASLQLTVRDAQGQGVTWMTQNDWPFVIVDGLVIRAAIGSQGSWVRVMAWDIEQQAQAWDTWLRVLPRIAERPNAARRRYQTAVRLRLEQDDQELWVYGQRGEKNYAARLDPITGRFHGAVGFDLENRPTPLTGVWPPPRTDLTQRNAAGFGKNPLLGDTGEARGLPPGLRAWVEISEDTDAATLTLENHTTRWLFIGMHRGVDDRNLWSLRNGGLAIPMCAWGDALYPFGLGRDPMVGGTLVYVAPGQRYALRQTRIFEAYDLLETAYDPSRPITLHVTRVDQLALPNLGSYGHRQRRDIKFNIKVYVPKRWIKHLLSTQRNDRTDQRVFHQMKRHQLLMQQRQITRIRQELETQLRDAFHLPAEP